VEEEVSGGQQRPDKKGVFGEVFTEAQLLALLETQSFGLYGRDFAILLRAYRNLPVDAFEAFIPMYLQQGFDINAKSPDGLTFFEYIQTNTSQHHYSDILNRYISVK
jgi:hypothetical protein